MADSAHASTSGSYPPAANITWRDDEGGGKDALDFLDMDANGSQAVFGDNTDNDQQAPPIGGIPLSRTMTNDSISSIATVVPAFGKIVLGLAELCGYIDRQPSLQEATIIATELYSEVGVTYNHRFLILELQRSGRKAIYLRLDRLRGKTTPTLRLVRNLGKTEANDEAQLSSSKEILRGFSILENRQVFPSVATLGDLRILLGIVVKELITYQVWPQNCWFFCSLIQQHLERAGSGWFEEGDLKYSNLAQQVRARVASLFYEACQAPSSGSQPTSPGTIDSAAPRTVRDSTATGDEEAALLGDGGLAGGPAAGTLRPNMQRISSLNAQLSLNAHPATFNNLGGLLERLNGFVKMTDMAEIHPLAKLARGVVSRAYKTISPQIMDDYVRNLIEEMEKSCKMAQEAAVLREHSLRFDEIVGKILLQVIECTHFVKSYCGQSSFRSQRASGSQEQVQSYIASLRALCGSLLDQSSVYCTVTVYRMFDEVKMMKTSTHLNDMTFAPEARGDLEDYCLDGTRAEIIQAIVGWALSADLFENVIGWKLPKSSARILWLCGVAGSGKSQIAKAVAARLEQLNRLGSLYCCDHKNGTNLRPASLFSTIARNLADSDPLRKQMLVASIGDNRAIWASQNCREQFQRFILQPSRDLPVVGDAIVIIDAFDEIGEVRERAEVLSILTKRAHELPDGLRILVTSRFEQDIQDALRSSSATQVDHILMEDIPEDLTSRDINLYVARELQMGDDFDSYHIHRLVEAAGTSFLWASMACQFINDINDGDATLSRRDRFATITDTDSGLDGLFMRILDKQFGKSKNLANFVCVLAYIICAEEPPSLETLASLSAKDFNNSAADALSACKQIVRPLASLLIGTHDVKTPISPFHISFTNFLLDESRSGRYHVKLEDPGKRLVGA